jgi:hypothetical protein
VPREPELDRDPSPGSAHRTTAFKMDLQASIAEFVYGEPLKIPGELLTPSSSGLHNVAPPKASSGSIPHIPSNVRAEGPPKLRSRFSPPGRNSAGSGIPLERPLPDILAEAEDNETLCARQARVDLHG